MTVTLPEPTGATAASWSLIDVVRRTLTGKTDGAGNAVVAFPAVDADRWWKITRAVITCAGVGAQPPCTLYVVPDGSSPAQQFQVSGTTDGLFDEADYLGEGLWVLEGEQLLVVWAGAPANSQVVANLQLLLLART